MKQTSFLPKQRREHGGILAVGKRRSRRPLNIKNPLHLTLRSDLAKGRRSLMSHRLIVEKVLLKASKRFRVRIYEKAICGNHLHLLVKGQAREDLQNFFRVLAGHIAQEILRKYPLQPFERVERGGAPQKVSRGTLHPKNQRKFWSLLLYTRIVTWGREYQGVKKYIIQNVNEVLGLIKYKERKSRFGSSKGTAIDTG